MTDLAHRVAERIAERRNASLPPSLRSTAEDYLPIAEIAVEATKLINRDAMMNRTEAEWDALQDAIGTLWGLEPGHILSEDDVAGLRLMDTCRREEEEAATDAYHRGLEDGLRQQGGDALVEAERRTARYLVEKSTERAMRKFAEARNTEMEARLSALADELDQLASTRQEWADNSEIGGSKPGLHWHLRGKRYGYSHAAQLVRQALTQHPTRSEGSSSETRPQAAAPPELQASSPDGKEV